MLAWVPPYLLNELDFFPAMSAFEGIGRGKKDMNVDNVIPS
jgi:hypothetical protein